MHMMIPTLLFVTCIVQLCLGLPSPLKVAYVDTEIDCCVPSKTFIGMVSGGYNVVVLAFYQTATGPADAAIYWSERMNETDQIETMKQIHAMNGTVLISLGGANDNFWETADATELGTKIANWAIANHLDGVDLDLEHFGGFNAINGSEASTIAWFATIIKTMKGILGPKGIISLAPLGPWFGPIGMEKCTSAGQLNCSWVGPSGGMTAVYKAVGQDIDYFFNQMYNQGDCYSTQEGLFYNSGVGCTTKGAYYPYTSIKEIHDTGIPYDKIVIGKPVDARSANGGYVDPNMLHTWIVNATQELGFNGGVGVWEWVDVFGSEAIPFIKAVYP